MTLIRSPSHSKRHMNAGVLTFLHCWLMPHMLLMMTVRLLWLTGGHPRANRLQTGGTCLLCSSPSRCRRPPPRPLRFRQDQPSQTAVSRSREATCSTVSSGSPTKTRPGLHGSSLNSGRAIPASRRMKSSWTGKSSARRLRLMTVACLPQLVEPGGPPRRHHPVVLYHVCHNVLCLQCQPCRAPTSIILMSVSMSFRSQPLLPDL